MSPWDERGATLSSLSSQGGPGSWSTFQELLEWAAGRDHPLVRLAAWTPRLSLASDHDAAIQALFKLQILDAAASPDVMAVAHARLANTWNRPQYSPLDKLNSALRYTPDAMVQYLQPAFEQMVAAKDAIGFAELWACWSSGHRMRRI